MTTVITIDDHPLFRKGLAQLLEMDKQLELIGEAASGREGIKLAEKLRPELILLDLNMAEMDGIETLRHLKKSELDAHIVMMTVSDHEEDLVAAIRSGADGYLLKDMEPEDTLLSINKVINGEMVISNRLTSLLAHALKAENTIPDSASQAGLTERELEIVKQIAQGHSNKIIARQLNIVESTVKVHVKHALKKLKLKSRVEIAVWATNNLHD
ncbi:MAG: two-component system response regulator NarL [Gammaproteobacteria bacterium]|nr:two-component system response regulator NarL [Gammaproteobacteria bacterium]